LEILVMNRAIASKRLRSDNVCYRQLSLKPPVFRRKVLSMKPFAIIVFLLCLSALAVCQDDLGLPESIADGLKSGDQKTQSKLAYQLRFRNFDPDQDFKLCDIHVDDIRLDERGGTSVLQVKCGYNLNVVVLRRTQASAQLLDSRYFYAAYDRLRLEFASLVRPPLKELVVHNAATVSGNVYESYFLVLRLADEKLHVVLSRLENGSEPRTGGAARLQKSEFVVRPVADTRAAEIEETATISIGKRSYLVRRSFTWSEDWGAFVEDGVADLRSKNSS